MVDEIGRQTVAGIPDVPVYGTDNAVALLREIAEAIEDAWERGLPPDIICASEDAAAIRWALERLSQEARI